jgi:hypothetical protein
LPTTRLILVPAARRTRCGRDYFDPFFTVRENALAILVAQEDDERGVTPVGRVAEPDR